MKFVSIGLPVMSQSNRSHKKNAHEGQQGFTLLETLTALTIAAFALTALFQTFTTGLRAVSITDDHTQARMLARALLSEHTQSWTKAPQSERGKYKNFAWEISINQADASLLEQSAKSKWRLYHVAVTVSWNNNRQITFQTLKLGPGRSGPGNG